MPKPQIYEIKDLPPDTPFHYKIVTPRKARKEHPCKVCPAPIVKGEIYCEITNGGSGLGDLKFPDRTHERCLERYMEKEREKWR
jgi:hypothetical protein